MKKKLWNLDEQSVSFMFFKKNSGIVPNYFKWGVLDWTIMVCQVSHPKFCVTMHGINLDRVMHW